MNRSLLWVTSVVFGAAETLLLGSFGLLFGTVFVVLMVPLVVRGDHLVVLSGLLLGFGGLWLLLMANQLATSGSLDNATTWTMVGAVPFAIGVVLGLANLTNHRSRARPLASDERPRVG